MKRRQFLKTSAGLGAIAVMPGVGHSAISASTLPSEITSMSAVQLSDAIRSRQVSCAEVMSAYLGRIGRYNPVYNAVVSMADEDILMAEARNADEELAKGQYRGWMHGMPMAIKDLADAEGLQACYGSKIFEGHVADADSLHVARMRAQGAIFIGKTNTPEFGLGSQSYNNVHGTTKNAYDPFLVAGGSSGGAATAMATHMVPIADGSDMMGSLRNPAAFNNVIGFRPSQGRVPDISSELFYHQLATDGPMGRNVSDTIRLLVTMAGHDSRAPLSLRDSLPSYDTFKPVSLKNYKIGWLGDYNGYLIMEEGVLPLCENSLNGLTDHGAIVEPCSPDYDMARLWETWLTFRHWAISSGLLRTLYDDPKTRNLLKPEIVWEVEGGLNMPASRVAKAAVARADWYRALESLFQTYDILALPTAQVFPFDANIHWPKSINGKPMDTYHRWMETVIGGTLGGIPVVNLPAGFDKKGRPMGIQFMGRMGQDKAVMEFALAYEAATDHLERRPVLKSG